MNPMSKGFTIMPRGPKPRPKEILKLAGSRRADLTNDDVDPKPSLSDPPVWMSRFAKREWKRVGNELMKLGLVTEIDRTVLALYCQAFADYVDAKAFVDEYGLTTTTEKGNVIQHPIVGVMNKAWERCLKAATQFGMSPSSRRGIVAKEQSSGGDGKSKYFGIA